MGARGVIIVIDPEGIVNPALTGDHVRQILRRVQEPSMNINVVDLGLVYEVWIAETGFVHVNMIHPRPNSSASVALADWVREALLAELPGVRQVGVSLLAEPSWDPSMMSDEARLHLGGCDHENP